MHTSRVQLAHVIQYEREPYLAYLAYVILLGEIGNDFELNPTGWNSQYTAEQITCLHSCNTIVCVVAERYENTALLRNKSRRTLSASQRDGARSFSRSFSLSQDLAPRRPPQTAMASYMRELALLMPLGLGSPLRRCKNRCTNLPEYVPPGPTNYQDFQRGMSFMDVAVPNHNGVAFWTHPGGLDGLMRYAKSEPCEQVDFFVSHALRADPSSPNKMMKTPIVYAIQKATDIFVGSHSAVQRLVARGEVQADDAFGYMCERKYWVDIGCVEQVDVAKKMYVITRHLSDFVFNARFVLCVVSTHYFTRAWCVPVASTSSATLPRPAYGPTCHRCLYEFCICLKRKKLDTVVVANSGVTWFESERRTVADCIVHCSLETSICFHQADRKLIDAR